MKIRIKPVLGALAILMAGLPSLSHADWEGPDDGSGYWGPPFCSTQPADFTGICMATPEEFSYTLVQFRLRKASDKSFVNLASAPQSFNFASETAGLSLGEFASGASLPADTYDAFGFIGSGNATLRGAASLNGGDGPRCRTTTSGVAMGEGAAQNYSIDVNDTPLFDPIGPGSDDIEGQVDGPGIEVDYVNPSGQYVHINDSLNGTVFPITVEAGQSLIFDFSMRPVKGLAFVWEDGVCTGAYTGDMQVRISASVETTVE